MNTKLKDIFRGKVVNKAHTLNTGVDEFPRYVLEYLIDNYCAEETFEQDMEKVVRRLKENFVFGAEAEKIRHYIRENRRHSVIASLEARLVETEDKYWATLSAINENFVNIPEEIVRQYPSCSPAGCGARSNWAMTRRSCSTRRFARSRSSRSRRSRSA